VVLKSDASGGDGVVARITRNGATIWGPQAIAYNNQSGVESNLDNLNVNAGDTIRFIVDSGGNSDNTADLTSWVPIVAVTQATTDTTAPTVSTGLTTTAVSSSQINLSWTASTFTCKKFERGVYYNPYFTIDTPDHEGEITF
jgi:hypothetical protein